MDRPNTILVYSDYKSPYAFLAKDLIYELEDHFDVHLEWLPYTLGMFQAIPGGSVNNERGEVIELQTATPTNGAECATRTWTAGTSPQARSRSSWNAQNMGSLYRGDRHVVG